MHKDVPILRRKVYYHNKNEMGNIEDVYGTTLKYGFVVELGNDIKAESFKPGDLIYGTQFNMLSLDRFLAADKKPAPREKALNQQGRKLKICIFNFLGKMAGKQGFKGGRGGFGGRGSFGGRGGYGGRGGGRGGPRGAPRGRGSFGGRGAPRGRNF